jgi:hypothetical protein
MKASRKRIGGNKLSQTVKEIPRVKSLGKRHAKVTVNKG